MSPPLGTFPSGVRRSTIWGRKAASIGKQLGDVHARPRGELLDRVGPERLAQGGRLELLVVLLGDPRIHGIAETGPSELVEQPIEAADPGQSRADTRRATPTGRPTPTLLPATASSRCRPSSGPPGAVRSGRRWYAGQSPEPVPPTRLPAPPASSQSHVRSRLSRLRPVRSRWIGVTAMRRLTTAWKSVPGTARPGRRRAADPEVGDAARVLALDQLVLVDALAEAGHLERGVVSRAGSPAR